MTDQERHELMARIETLEAENAELKEGAERRKVLETGYHSLERASTTWRSEYTIARRRVERLEKEAADHKQRLRKLQELADACKRAMESGLIDRLVHADLVAKLEGVGGEQDASRNRRG